MSATKPLFSLSLSLEIFQFSSFPFAEDEEGRYVRRQQKKK